MSSARRWFGGSWLLLTLALGGSAAAEPSIWDVARQPGLDAEYRTLVSVEWFLLGHASAWDEMNVHKGTIDYLRGERYLDPRLELLVAELRVETTLRGEQGVRERLLDTLQRHPDLPLASHGYLELGRVAALQGDLDAARRYYGRALAGLWEPELRTAAFYGRAKAAMESGSVHEALPDYQEAVLSARSPKSRALAHWGRGVALERAGNLNAAMRELRIATSIPIQSTAFIARTVLDLPDVFFVPAFDKHYYKALAAMAEADDSDVAAQAILDLQSSITYFGRYLREAEPTQHYFVNNARRLSSLCEARIRTLQQRDQSRDQSEP